MTILAHDIIVTGLTLTILEAVARSDAPLSFSSFTNWTEKDKAQIRRITYFHTHEHHEECINIHGALIHPASQWRWSCRRGRHQLDCMQSWSPQTHLRQHNQIEWTQWQMLIFYHFTFSASGLLTSLCPCRVSCGLAKCGEENWNPNGDPPARHLGTGEKMSSEKLHAPPNWYSIFCEHYILISSSTSQLTSAFFCASFNCYS